MTAPRNPQDLVAELRNAAANGETRVAQGLGTRPVAALSRAAKPLSVLGLCQNLEIDEAELIMTVSAGVPLAEIEAQLAPRGLFLPPLFPGPVHGTIGGLYNDPREPAVWPRWGRPRDHALGVTAVRGDGTLFHAGGRVVKNVTGYDLTRFLCGSRGRYAVTTSLHWRLLRRPEMVRSATLTFASSADAWEALRRLRGRPFEPLRVDYDVTKYRVRVLECGREDVVPQLLERQLGDLGEDRCEFGPVPPGETPPDNGTPEGTPDQGTPRLRVRLPFRQWPGILDETRDLTWDPIHPFAQFGGVEAPDAARTDALVHQVEARRGSVCHEVVTDQSPPLAETQDPRLGELSRKLREEWDPSGVLAGPS